MFCGTGSMLAAELAANTERGRTREGREVREGEGSEGREVREVSGW